MAFWDTVAFVVLVGVIGSVIHGRQRYRYSNAKNERTERDDDTEHRIAKLEDRVRVLERIVTDKRERLKDEIDAL